VDLEDFGHEFTVDAIAIGKMFTNFPKDLMMPNSNVNELAPCKQIQSIVPGRPIPF